MITKENLEEVIKQISPKDKKRIIESIKEYCVIYLHTFNVGCFTTITLTDNFKKFKTVTNQGNCMLETEEVLNIIYKQEEC